MKKIIALILSLTLVFSLAACGGNGEAEVTTEAPVEFETSAQKYVAKFGALYGPFGIASTVIARDRAFAFNVEFFSSITDVMQKLKDGDLEIATLPIREALKLYNETNGAVKIINASNECFMYVVQKGDAVKSLADLDGKKVYSLGKDTSNDKIAKHLFASAGVAPEIEYVDTFDNLKAKDDADLVLLAEPYASQLLYTSEGAYMGAIDIGLEWKNHFGFDLVQACVVARADFIEAHPESVVDFLTYYEVSVNYMNDIENRGTTIPETLIEYKFFNNIEHSLLSTSMCGLIFAAGDELKPLIASNIEQLLAFDSDVAGITAPGDAICY